MKKNYETPQMLTLEVAVEGEVFAGSVGMNSFGTPTSVDTSNLGTGSSSASSSFSLRDRVTPTTQSESNEIYDDLFK